jgi:hypothetical protein
MSTPAKVVVILIGMLVAYLLVFSANRNASGRAEVARSTVAAAPSCDVSRIAVKDIDGGFVDECSARNPCPSFKGTATITNTCPTPVGVQVKITAYDAAGAAIATRELWPASTRNIPPGDYPFTMDTWLDYDERVVRFGVEPIEVRSW